MRNHRKSAGFSVWHFIVIVGLLVIVAAIVFPMLVRNGHNDARKASCQSNLKELAVSMQMYWNDYNGAVPSSVLRQMKPSKEWNPQESAQFCSQRGPFPIPPGKLAPEQIHWGQLLLTYMKNTDIVWCPSDPNRTVGNTPRDHSALVSYFYKPALDRAWFGSMCPVKVDKPNENLVMKCFRKELDFEYIADQIMFFERLGWHWRNNERGWRDGVSLNCAYMDGHVRRIRLVNSLGRDAPETIGEFVYTISEPGEPMWYNHDATLDAAKKTEEIDYSSPTNTKAAMHPDRVINPGFFCSISNTIHPTANHRNKPSDQTIAFCPFALRRDYD